MRIFGKAYGAAGSHSCGLRLGPRLLHQEEDPRRPGAVPSEPVVKEGVALPRPWRTLLSPPSTSVLVPADWATGGRGWGPVRDGLEGQQLWLCSPCHVRFLMVMERADTEEASGKHCRPGRQAGPRPGGAGQAVGGGKYDADVSHVRRLSHLTFISKSTFFFSRNSSLEMTALCPRRHRIPGTWKRTSLFLLY